MKEIVDLRLSQVGGTERRGVVVGGKDERNGLCAVVGDDDSGVVVCTYSRVVVFLVLEEMYGFFAVFCFDDYFVVVSRV
ncbi:MAG: hypothetical protein P8178_04095, partial [Candidatus Thiodiazotropha sp.]